jgi:hypothetical protein
MANVWLAQLNRRIFQARKSRLKVSRTCKTFTAGGGGKTV